MITPEKLKQLESFNNSRFMIMSVYLGSDSLQAPFDKYLISEFHSLLHQNFDKKMRETFRNDIARIETYLDNYAPSARTLAIFSAGDKLWEIIEFEFSIENSLSVDFSPNLDPIRSARQKYSKYLVLLVDREKARMFTVDQGEIAEHADYMGEYIPQDKKTIGHDGYPGQNNIHSRHLDILIDRHIDEVSKKLAEFVKSQDIDFVIIGGHKEMFVRVANSLPADLKNKLVGSFVSELNIPLNDILQESKRVAELV